MPFLTSKLLKNVNFAPLGHFGQHSHVDHMCVILPNEVWGLVSIYLKSLPLKYHVKKSKTHREGVEKTIFFALQAVDGITNFTFRNKANTFKTFRSDLTRPSILSLGRQGFYLRQKFTIE